MMYVQMIGDGSWRPRFVLDDMIVKREVNLERNADIIRLITKQENKMRDYYSLKSTCSQQHIWRLEKGHFY